MLAKLQKWASKTDDPLLASSLELMVYCRNIASLSLFCRSCFDRCSSELAAMIPHLIFTDNPLFILIGCMIFLPSCEVVIWNYMSNFCTCKQLESGIICLKNPSFDLWSKWLKCRVNKHLLTFLISFPVSFHLFLLFFLVTPGLKVSVQPN